MTERKMALITGATSGIGRAFAERFASMGYDLIITGRRQKLIRKVAREITARHGVEVRVVIAELSDEAGVRQVLKEISECAALAALVNNAGYGMDGLFSERSIGEHLALAGVMVTAPLRFIHAALPGMIARREGIIINVSSLGAWAPAPSNGVYGGSKSFLNVFTESLHLEVRHYGIRVQALCPGFTSTDFHRQMGVEKEMQEIRVYWMKPAGVVDYSMKCLERGRVICVPGLVNRALRAVMAFLPRKLYYRMAGKR
ncbi:MAG: SDR family NAD(P)-dependent oxidoreductase [Spirochaetes bacterium]|nr:SDR family NAD(P)-dependent oxidoreductase [Spirochaetota bacterium]